jgi:DNA-binding MarR family transcriptional regulator
MPPSDYVPAARFRTALRHFLRESEVAARADGITPRQYVLLLQIAASEDGVATVTELVDRLALTQSTVTELVQRAEAAGLVARRTSQEDARVVELRLTDDGERRLSRVHDRLGGERVKLRGVIDSLD